MENSCDCGKPQPLCVCGGPKWVNRRFVFLLRHPREPGEVLGTAPLVTSLLENARIKTALSLPGLKKELGETVVYSRWLVLYPGSRYRLKPLKEGGGRILRVLDKACREVDWQPDQFDGIVVLDGTWPQVKSLWWRNPWLLKCRRGVLVPPRPSLYGDLRREPRRENLSTIEAVAYALEALGEDPSISQGLWDMFDRFLRVYRQWQRTDPGRARPGAPPPG